MTRRVDINPLVTSEVYMHLLFHRLQCYTGSGRVETTVAVHGKEDRFIIIIYFEKVTFFHAKLGLDICPWVDNQTSGERHCTKLTQPLSTSRSVCEV